jgi:hypothetical protein
MIYYRTYIYDQEFNTASVVPVSKFLRYVVLLLLIVGVSYNGKVRVTGFVKVAQKLQERDIQHDVLAYMHTFILY